MTPEPKCTCTEEEHESSGDVETVRDPNCPEHGRKPSAPSATPDAGAGAEPRCTCKQNEGRDPRPTCKVHGCRCSHLPGDRADCPKHGRKPHAGPNCGLQPAPSATADAGEDEAAQIAAMLWDGRMLPDHASRAIRALVAKREAEALKRAADIVRNATGEEPYSELADAIEREGRR